MDWAKLLSKRRLGERAGAEQANARSPFQRDQDRLIFAPSFRRLHDKTQVFPMPENDHVHSRLTHTIETASVGRSLGNLVGSRVVARHKKKLKTYIAGDFGDIVAAACLAHDLGNPPFGHAGEDAIGTWCFNWFEHVRSDATLAKQFNAAVASLPSEEEFTKFEGNAQGFRLIARLQSAYRPGGLQLTFATLGAFTKYPRTASVDPGKYPGVSAKKFGIFSSELSLFRDVATALGVEKRGGSDQWWCRHPLAFLVEAADDICYRILDIEDGHRLGLLTNEQLEALLAPIARKSHTFSKVPKPSRKAPHDYLPVLRAHAINALVNSVADVFADHEGAILAGEFDKSLLDCTPFEKAVKRIKDATKAHCYVHPAVLQTELTGYEVVAGLLSRFVPAALASKRSPQQEKLFNLLPVPAQEAIMRDASAYERLLTITDFVSGMTDNFAVSTYRRLAGISLPVV